MHKYIYKILPNQNIDPLKNVPPPQLQAAIPHLLRRRSGGECQRVNRSTGCVVLEEKIVLVHLEEALATLFIHPAFHMGVRSSLCLNYLTLTDNLSLYVVWYKANFEWKDFYWRCVCM